MADITISFTIPDAYVSRFSAVVDYIWPGRVETSTDNKVEWTKRMIVYNLKQQVLKAEKDLSAITEIVIT